MQIIKKYKVINTIKKINIIKKIKTIKMIEKSRKIIKLLIKGIFKVLKKFKEITIKIKFSFE